MLTIDRLVKIDTIATRIIAALRRGVGWVEDKYEDCLVDAAYKTVERKAAAIGKVEDKISDLKDAQCELWAHGAEAKALLQGKYRAALAALGEEQGAKADKLEWAFAAAAEALVAARKDYDATVRAASEQLDVKVEA